MKATFEVRIKVVDETNGLPVTSGKLEICGADGFKARAYIHGRFATFTNINLKKGYSKTLGTAIEVLLNGEPIGKTELPKETENGIATIEMKFQEAASEPEENFENKEAVDAEDMEQTDQHVVKVLDSNGNPVQGAVVYANSIPYVTEDGVVKIPMEGEDFSIEIVAPGFKPKKTKVESDDVLVKVRLEAASKVKKPQTTSWQTLATAGILLLLLVLLVVVAPKNQNTGVSVDLPSAVNFGVQTMSVFTIVGSIIAAFYAAADRFYRQQGQDLILGLIAFALFQLSGWNGWIGLAQNYLGTYGLQAILFVLALGLLYAAAILGTPDFTTPGAFWLANVAVAVLTGTLGPITDWAGLDGKIYTIPSLIQGISQGLSAKNTMYVIGALVFGATHFIVDISGVFFKGEDPNEKLGSLALTGLVLLVYYLLAYFGVWQPVVRLITVAGGAMLVAEAGKAAYGAFATESGLTSSLGKAILRTKWDGVALGIAILMLVALTFGYV